MRRHTDQRMPIGLANLDFDDLPDERPGPRRLDVHDLVAIRAALDAALREVAFLALARALDEHTLARSDERRKVRGAERLGYLEQEREPLALYLRRDVIAEAQRRSVRPWGILECEERNEPDFAH